MDLANGLRELYDLYRCGALTEEEYAAAKATVLGKPIGQQQQQQQQPHQQPHPSSASPLPHSHAPASVAGGSPRHLLPRAPLDASHTLPLPAATLATGGGCAASDAEDASAEDPWHNLSLSDVVSPTFSSCLTLAEQADSCIRSLVRGDAAPEPALDADPAGSLLLPPYHHAAAATSDSVLQLPSSGAALPLHNHHHHHLASDAAAATASPLFPTVVAATATPPPVLDGTEEHRSGAGNPLLTSAQASSPLPEPAASLVREGHALLRAGDEGYRRNLHKLELLEMEVAALERRGRLDSIERTLADGVAEAARLGASADVLSREAETAAVAAGFHPPAVPAAAALVGGGDAGFAALPPPPPPPPPPVAAAPHVGGVGGAFNAVHAAQALDVDGFEAAALPRPPVPQPRTSVRAPGSLCSPPPSTQRTMPPMLWDVTLCRGVHVSSDLREATCVAGGSGGGEEGGEASGAAHVVVGTVAYDPLVVMELPERRFEWSVVLLLKSPASRDILVGVTGRGVSGTATFVLRGDGCAISEQSVEGTQLRMGYSPPLGGASSAEGHGSLMTTATVTCKAVNNTLHFDVNGESLGQAFELPDGLLLYPMVVLCQEGEAALLPASGAVVMG